MSFLPAVCSFVQDTQTSAGVGPVAIILCASSSNVLNVARLCRQFVGDENAVEVVEGYGERCINRIVVSLPKLNSSKYSNFFHSSSQYY